LAFTHHTDIVLWFNPSDCFVFQFSLLRMIGGETPKDTVKLLMNRLLTNYVMSFLSLDGRSHGKLAFRNTPLCQVVIGKNLFSLFCFSC